MLHRHSSSTLFDHNLTSTVPHTNMANNEPQIQPSAAALVTNERIARLEEKDLQKETTITGLSDDIRSLKRLQDGHRIECKEDFAARAELT